MNGDRSCSLSEQREAANAQRAGGLLRRCPINYIATSCLTPTHLLLSYVCSVLKLLNSAAKMFKINHQVVTAVFTTREKIIMEDREENS